jgi:hypothetical protein
MIHDIGGHFHIWEKERCVHPLFVAFVQVDRDSKPVSEILTIFGQVATDHLLDVPLVRFPLGVSSKFHAGVFIEVHRVVHVVLLEPLIETKAQWLVLPLFRLLIVWLVLFRAVRTCPSAVGLIPLVLLVLLHLERVDLPSVVALLPP